MFGDPREVILKDIESFTKETISESLMDSGLNTIYKSFGDHLSDCLYLLMVKGMRVLVYGMEMDKTPPPNYDYLFEKDDEGDASSPFQEKISMFCRSLELDNQYELAALLDSKDEYFIEAMEDRVPHEKDDNEDFFIRNALWLMNPTIH